MRLPLLTYTTFLLGLVLLALAGAFVFQIPFPAFLEKRSELNQMELEYIRIIIDVDKLLIGWALALIGGTVVLLTRYGNKLPKSSFVDILMVVCFLLEFSSIYFGLQTFGRLIEMLEKSVFNTTSEALMIVRAAQYYSLLLAILLLGTLFIFTWRDIKGGDDE